MTPNHSEIRERANKVRWQRKDFQTVALANSVIGLAQKIGSDNLPGPMQLAYRDSYIAVRVMRKTFKFIVCQFVLFQKGPTCTFRIRRCAEVSRWLEETPLQYTYVTGANSGYRIQLTARDVSQHAEIIKRLAQRAYDEHPFSIEPMWRKMFRFEIT